MSGKTSNEEILTVISIICIVLLVAGLIVAFGQKLAEIKDNTPVIFWLIIAGIIIAIPLLILGSIKLYLYVKNKGYF